MNSIDITILRAATLLIELIVFISSYASAYAQHFMLCYVTMFCMMLCILALAEWPSKLSIIMLRSQVKPQRHACAQCSS